jgi:DNA (cytosine-5)-methyltransferase 1
LDLFSGIGGNSIGLHDYVRVVSYCERDAYAQSVLLSRFADGSLEPAPIWDDITTLTASQFDIPIDIIIGGFPCQDISLAGNGAGLDGERSGLVFEIFRLIVELAPKFIFLENVSAIRTRGGERVVKELAGLGYDCRWDMLSAYDVGAPHKRERWFLLGYANSGRQVGKLRNLLSQNAVKGGSEIEGQGAPNIPGNARCESSVLAFTSDTNRIQLWDAQQRKTERWDGLQDCGGSLSGNDGSSQPMADTQRIDWRPVNSSGCNMGGHNDGLQKGWQEAPGRTSIGSAEMANTNGKRLEVGEQGESGQCPPFIGGGWGSVESNVGGVLSDGIPCELDRGLPDWERMVRGVTGLQAKEVIDALMQGLRMCYGEEKIWKSTRRPIGLSAQEVLRPFLHGEGLSQGIAFEVCDPVASDRIQKELVRILRIEHEFMHSPHRWKLDEQWCGKLEDALLVLSYAFASHSGRLGAKEIESSMQHLWTNFLSSGVMLNASDSVQKAWESLDGSWQRSIALGPWNLEPPIPRVAYGVPNRVDRIKCLGNAVVPCQAKEAFERLAGLKSANSSSRL